MEEVFDIDVVFGGEVCDILFNLYVGCVWCVGKVSEYFIWCGDYDFNVCFC